jgi:hypothetical protein
MTHNLLRLLEGLGEPSGDLIEQGSCLLVYPKFRGPGGDKLTLASMRPRQVLQQRGPSSAARTGHRGRQM